MIPSAKFDTQEIRISKVIRYFKRILIGSTILCLIALNVATVVNEGVHKFSYQALKGLTALTLGEVIQSRLFSGSPTARKNLEIARATKALQDEKNALKNENFKLVKSNQDLNLKLSKRSQVASRVLPSMRARASRVALRNATSVVGEAIPYIGIAVMLGVTAADLYDMCEQDKEISALLASNELVIKEQYPVCGMKLPSQQQVVAQLKSGWEEAYMNGVRSVNQSGRYIESLKPPQVVWADLKSSVCPILSYNLAICD